MQRAWIGTDRLLARSQEDPFLERDAGRSTAATVGTAAVAVGVDVVWTLVWLKLAS